jgi:hypothetical protein
VNALYRYYKGMKNNTKSSITLPSKEYALVLELKKILKAKSNVDVIRRGLLKLKEGSERESLRAQFSEASQKVRKSTLDELKLLDHLASEGMKKKK